MSATFRKTPFLVGLALLLILTLLAWLAMRALGEQPTFGPTTIPARLPLTPEEVIEQLDPAQEFTTISQDFSNVLAVPVHSLQVRLQPKGCSACEMKENAERDILSIAEAEEFVPESDAAWLIKDDMMCFYMLQKNSWTPKSCSIWQ